MASCEITQRKIRYVCHTACFFSYAQRTLWGLHAYMRRLQSTMRKSIALDDMSHDLYTGVSEQAKARQSFG